MKRFIAISHILASSLSKIENSSMRNISSLATIIGSFVAVATLVNGFWQYRRKIHLEIFRAYADRYNAILTPDIYEKWIRAIEGRHEDWEELRPTMIRYLNLVWEEFYLAKGGLIPARLWQLWLPEISRVLSSEYARSIAKTHEFHFPAEFDCRTKSLRSRITPVHSA
jgi:hypothetical protein